ncbi:uncharacterized protein LOC111066796 isoform X3 [Drosophila obscura]|uniref:uncharacterized protein LOC111066796 isoform X2 n=1 Tax=Drosophila obscura TaxID=7282 RepID=UPI001BB0F0DF|nr:uncharacterized protein LOC111066796 isoform X2 [Drosophila obscura]XP_022211362.2 uncharacterized protein LOC111066796 isoform X3 [Drosophila obscura]
MKSNREKGCRILFERQERISIEKGQRISIKNTKTEVSELFRRTAGNLEAEGASAISNKELRARQKVCELNQRINREIDQLKLLRHNILPKPVKSEASESNMELHDNKAAARQTAENQSSVTHDRHPSDTEFSQEDIDFMSFRTVGLKKNNRRAEGGCNYIPRQKDKTYDQYTQSVYQCDYGNPSRCITCFPVAQRQFQDNNNCVCCTLRPSVPIPVLADPCCQYQPSWACVTSCPRTATDLHTEDFCRNWCACIMPDSTLRSKQKSPRAPEERSGSKSRSSSKASKLLDENMRRKVKKSGVKIDSASLDQYKVQSHEKLLKVTMKKEIKSPRQRGSKPQAGEEKSKTGEGKQTDEGEDSMHRDYVDKYKKENGHAENDVAAASRAQDHAQDDGSGEAVVHLGGTEKTADDEYADDCGPDYCNTDPICTTKKRVGKGRAVCLTKKCACSAREFQTDQEYTDQRKAQDLAQVDESDPRSGQKGVRPDGNGKPGESANDEKGDDRYADRYGPGHRERDPISSPDKGVEKSMAVCHQCACVAREAQTDDESIKKEARLTQTDLQLKEERPTQTDFQGSLHERPTQTDMDGSRHERLTQTDLQGSQYKGLAQTEPELSHQINTAVSPLSGATVKESKHDFEDDIQTASQKENPSADQKQIQGQYSPPISSRRSYSPQSPSSRKYEKFISRGSLTEEAKPDADTKCSSNCARYRVGQCPCKPVSPGPRQRPNAYKEEQCLIDDGDSPVGAAGRLEKSSPFCAPLTSADKCDTHPVGCNCDVNRNVDKSTPSGSTEHTDRSMASSPVKSQKTVPANIDQHQPYESTYQQSYGRSADPGNGQRDVDITSYDEDNGPSTERSPEHPIFLDHSQTQLACATDCTGRKLSGRNLSYDSYQEPQPTSWRLEYDQYSDGREINPAKQSLVPRLPGLSQFAASFPCATYNNDECKNGLPIMVCEKRTRSVTFEDKSGKVRRMRNIVEHCRRSIDWQQVLKHRIVERDGDRDGDNTSQSEAAFGGNSSTDEDDCTYTCRSSSSAGTEMTCVESNYDLHEDTSNYEHDSRSQPNYGSIPQFNHCPCMLRTYVSLASICTTNSTSFQYEGGAEASAQI